MSESNGVQALWSAVGSLTDTFARMGGGERYPGFDDSHVLLGTAVAVVVVLHGPELCADFDARAATKPGVFELLALAAARHPELHGVAGWVPLERWPFAAFAEVVRTLHDSRCPPAALRAGLVAGIRQFESRHRSRPCTASWQQMRAWIGLSANGEAR